MGKTEKTESKFNRFIKFRKLKKQRGLINRLRNLRQKLIKKGAVDQTLLSFIRDIEDPIKQKNAWQLLLKRKDLTPNNLDEIANATTDETLKREAQQKYVSLATEDDLFYTIKYGDKIFQEMAFKELCERVSKGVIKKARAREILSKIIEDIPDFRITAFDVYKYLDPTDKELKHLIDVLEKERTQDGETIKLRRQIEGLIRKRPKNKDFNTKLILDINKIVEKIKKIKEG